MGVSKKAGNSREDLVQRKKCLLSCGSLGWEWGSRVVEWIQRGGVSWVKNEPRRERVGKQSLYFKKTKPNGRSCAGWVGHVVAAPESQGVFKAEAPAQAAKKIGPPTVSPFAFCGEKWLGVPVHVFQCPVRSLHAPLPERFLSFSYTGLFLIVMLEKRAFLRRAPDFSLMCGGEISGIVGPIAARVT